MTMYAKPLPTFYYVTPPLPTTIELLDRISYRLLESGPGPFNKRWEMARHCSLVQVAWLQGQELSLIQLEAQRASLAYLNHAGSL